MEATTYVQGLRCLGFREWKRKLKRLIAFAVVAFNALGRSS